MVYSTVLWRRRLFRRRRNAKLCFAMTATTNGFPPAMLRKSGTSDKIVATPPEFHRKMEHPFSELKRQWRNSAGSMTTKAYQANGPLVPTQSLSMFHGMLQ